MDNEASDLVGCAPRTTYPDVLLFTSYTFRFLQPPAVYIERNRLKRFGVHLLLSIVRTDQDPTGSFSSINFQRPLQGLNKPNMADLFASVDRHLAYAIDTPCGRRDYFTYPVWGEFEVRNVDENRHTLSTPAGKVGNKDVWA